jgi:hypothetical protein
VGFLGQAFMVRVSNRRIEVIDYLVDSRIALVSILVIDAARVYVNIHTRLGIEHESVNCSVNFVNPTNTAINRNMIESRWAAVKQKIKSYKNTNFVESCIAQYLYEFENFYPLKEKFSYGKRFEKLVSDVVRVYVGSDSNKIPLELIVDEWDQIINNQLMFIKKR